MMNCKKIYVILALVVSFAIQLFCAGQEKKLSRVVARKTLHTAVVASTHTDSANPYSQWDAGISNLVFDYYHCNAEDIYNVYKAKIMAEIPKEDHAKYIINDFVI